MLKNKIIENCYFKMEAKFFDKVSENTIKIKELYEQYNEVYINVLRLLPEEHHKLLMELSDINTEMDMYKAQEIYNTAFKEGANLIMDIKGITPHPNMQGDFEIEPQKFRGKIDTTVAKLP